MLHDVDGEARHRLRILTLAHCTPTEMAELKSVDAKPFGAKAQFDRLCRAMKSRYGSTADDDGCMPTVMKNRIQVVFDGASVNQALHGHIMEQDGDILGTVDVSHQLDRAVVHAVRTSPMYGKYVPAVQSITNTIRKSEVHSLTMEAMSTDGEQALQRIIKTRWSRSLFTAITIFMSRYVLVRGIVKDLTANGKDQTKWKAMYTIMYLGNFVVFMYGLLQFLQHVAHAQEAMQHVDATWATKQQAVAKLMTAVDTDLEKESSKVQQNPVTKNWLFGNTPVLQPTAEANAELKEIREMFKKQVRKRLKNSHFLLCVSQLVDGSTWPTKDNVEEVTEFGNDEVRQLVVQWARRLQRLGVDGDALYTEWQQLKALYAKSDMEAGVPMLKHAIRNKNLFPLWHTFGRMLLAVTPSNAAVERLFSRLRRILTDERTRLSEKHAEEELVLLVDAANSKVYPYYDEICRAYQKSRKRQRSKKPRKIPSDAGKKRKEKKKQKVTASYVNDSDTSSTRRSSTSSSSSSSSNSSSNSSSTNSSK